MDDFDVLAIGELNPDLILAGIRDQTPILGTEQAFDAHHLTLGSSTAITCVLMQRLGLTTAISAYVGDDEYGRHCRSILDTERVDARLVRTHPSLATGLTVCLPYPADRLLLTCKGTMSLNSADAVGADLLRRVRHVHVGSFFLQDDLRPALASLFATARALGVTTSLDTGWDPDGRWLTDDLRATLAHTSFLLPNAAEFEQLTGGSDVARGAKLLLDLEVGAIVLKRGTDGAVHVDADGIFASQGFAANAIDTTGAGDAFNAGYLAMMIGGGSIEDRLTFGNACGALTVAAIGGTGGVFDAAQVCAFITANGRS